MANMVESIWGYSEVAQYFKNQAEIVAATSMGRKGFFIKSINTKTKQTLSEGAGEPKKKSWFDFGGKGGGMDE
jgi:hypothetical protein